MDLSDDRQHAQKHLKRLIREFIKLAVCYVLSLEGEKWGPKSGGQDTLILGPETYEKEIHRELSLLETYRRRLDTIALLEETAEPKPKCVRVRADQ